MSGERRPDATDKDSTDQSTCEVCGGPLGNDGVRTQVIVETSPGRMESRLIRECRRCFMDPGWNQR
jgi:hypothetical protein